MHIYYICPSPSPSSLLNPTFNFHMNNFLKFMTLGFIWDPIELKQGRLCDHRLELPIGI